ncbi:hypothetical protein C8R44DRAFT_724380 [Mycena epipterygia]|nr:hypothetical protein C8R44DRAFT_724380 [Mycena epipterygia]
MNQAGRTQWYHVRLYLIRSEEWKNKFGSGKGSPAFSDTSFTMIIAIVGNTIDDSEKKNLGTGVSVKRVSTKARNRIHWGTRSQPLRCEKSHSRRLSRIPHNVSYHVRLPSDSVLTGHGHLVRGQLLVAGGRSTWPGVTGFSQISFKQVAQPASMGKASKINQTGFETLNRTATGKHQPQVRVRIQCEKDSAPRDPGAFLIAIGE